MGDYYEVCLRTTLHVCNDIDKAILKHWFNKEELPEILPNHELFKTEDWGSLFKYGTFYTYPELVTQYIEDEYGIRVFANFSIKSRKQTTNTIKLLFDYIGTLIHLGFIGYYRFESDTFATMVSKTYEGIEIMEELK